MEKFQYYAGDIKKSKPLGFIDINTFILKLYSPSIKIKNQIDAVAKASKEKNNKLKIKLKEKLFAFTPCAIVKDRRKYDNILSFTGFAVLDFDKIDNAIEFKKFIFDKYDFIFAVWLSPSKKGIKVLVNIPIVKNVDEFKSYFWGLAKEFNKYKGFDTTAQNPLLPLFISYDYDLLCNYNSKTWTIKGENPKKIKNIIPKELPKTNDNDYHKKWVINNTEKAINSINDNGHPQLRAMAYSLGGYVGAGYISKTEAESLICNLVARNNYLGKGIKGYQKTAIEMISQGISQPIYFDK